MDLYHYVPKDAPPLTEGILSVSLLPQELVKYAPRAGSDSLPKITAWLESTFPGRSRSISVLTEPVQTKGNDPMLTAWTKGKTLVRIDYTKLLEDRLIEGVWLKKGSQKGGINEKFDKISPNDIDFSPLPWHLCSEEKGLFFGAVHHYFLVMKNGLIPPEYIKELP